MKVSIVVGATDNDVISKDGNIPWSMPADFMHVRKLTWGKPIIMGRATHDHIGKTLEGRINIVVSTNRGYKASPGSILVHSLEEALNLKETKQADEVFIFGGEGIYKSALPVAQRIYLTRIHTKLDGDRFFKYDPKDWQEVSRDNHKKDQENPYDYAFIILERKSN